MDAPQHDTPQQPEPAPLRPSVALIVVSVINIVMSAASASVAMVGMELLRPHALSYNSLFLLAWALFVIIAQYQGTFRGNSQGAFFSGLGSPLCFAMLYVSIVLLRLISMDFLEMSPSKILGGDQLHYWLGIGILTITSLWFNGRWAWKLSRQTGGKLSWKPISISLKEILGFCVILGLIMVPATYRAHANQSTFRDNVAAADAPFSVPTAAQAITYERNREGLLLASYEIDEVPFRVWLSQSDSEMTRHGARWHDITTPITATSPSPDRLPWTLSYGNEIIAQGFRVIWQADDLHHVIVYDRDAKKAYYEQLPISE